MRITALGLAGATAVALLSGCGDSEGDTTAPPPPPPPTTPAAPSAPAGGADTAGAEVTPPGTKLKLGQRAVIPIKRASVTGTVGITVTAIEPGNQAAFQQQFGSKAQGLDPYYIRYTVTNVGGTDLSRISTPLLGAVGPNGGSTGATVIFTGELPGCARGRPDDSFATAGASFQHCRLQVARQGVPVTGAEYDDSEGGYRDNPIVWTK